MRTTRKSADKSADKKHPEKRAGRPRSGADHKTLAAAEKAFTRHPLARGFALGALVTVAMVVFIVQNTDEAGMSWLWWDFTAPLWLALLVAFVAGAVVGPLVVLGVRQVQRRRREQRDAVHRLAQAAKAPAAPTPAPAAPSAAKTTAAPPPAPGPGAAPSEPAHAPRSGAADRPTSTERSTDRPPATGARP